MLAQCLVELLVWPVLSLLLLPVLLTAATPVNLVRALLAPGGGWRKAREQYYALLQVWGFPAKHWL